MKSAIFQLIHSLDRKEKAHVSKYISMSKQDTAIQQLYQALNKMEAYNEAKLRKKFTHKLDNLKTKLLNKTLDALADYHKKNTPQTDTHFALLQLDILLQKNQLALLDKRLRKHLASAQKTENWTQVLQLLDIQLKRIKKKQDAQTAAGTLQTIFSLQQQCYTHLQEEAFWQHNYLQLNNILRNDHRLLNPENRQQFEAIGNQKTIDHLEQCSQKTIFYYHRAKNVYCRSTNQKEKAIEHAQQLALQLEPLKNDQYIDALCSLTRAYSANRQLNQVGEVLQKLKALPQFKNSELYVFEKVCKVSLRYYMNTLRFDELHALADQIEGKWEILKKELASFQLQHYCYNLIIAHWVLKDYSKAMFWLTNMLEFKYSKEGKNFQLGARFLELIIYYEYRPIELEKRLDTIRIVLNKHWELSDYERLVLTCFGKLSRTLEREHKEIIEEGLSDLSKYNKNPPMGCSELVFWFRSKLSGRPVLELLKEEQKLRMNA